MKTKIIFLLAGFMFSMGLSNAQWVNRYNGSGDFSDKFNAILADQSGNIFLAGSTVNPGTNRDLLLVKLNANGDTVWTNVYNGPGNGPDEALAMCFDVYGNIYTTGFQRGAGTGNDFITIKYNASGVIQWTAGYSYSLDESDQSNSITVDTSGNVYIAGQSDSDPSTTTNDDYVLIKYNASGIVLWTVRINGFGNGIDRPTKILLAPNGNIVVTGRSSNGFDDDYWTMEYSPSGSQVWSQLYDRLHTDRATGMAVDTATGNIFVTGRSSNGSNYDYATVCYNSLGIQQWAAIYDYVDDDRATFVGLDSTGNVYVAGQSDVNPGNSYNYDITTVKYNSSGAQQWVHSWSGSAMNDDSPGGFFVDASGNSFVAGITDTDPGAAISNDYVVIKYNSSGTQQWVNSYNRSGTANDIPFGIVEDPNGNVIVTGYSENVPQKDGVTIKYNASGVEQWIAYYNGAGDNSDNAHAIAVDTGNNVYVAGYTVEYENDRNFSLSKIDASGITQWTKTINGTSTASTDEAQSVALDAAGNIYVAGYTKNINVSYDFTIAKYNSLGDTVWVRYYNDTVANESDRAYAIALDADNHVYVTGRSDSDPTINSNDDILTVKYDSNGVFQWAQRYNGTGNGTDAAKSIKVSTSGHVYVAGKSYNGTNTDYVLLKYDTSGTLLWTRFYDGSTGDDECVSMAMDNSENIFLTGFSTGTNGSNTDAATVQYNSSGVRNWVIRFDGSSGGNDIGKSVTVDQAGNIIVTGSTDTDNSASTINNDIFSVKYNSNGIQQWIRFYNGTANGNDDVNEVAVDNANNIFITGQTDNGSAGIRNYDYITIKYNPSGAQTGTFMYNGSGNASDVSNTLLLKNNAIYITGGSYGTASERDIATIKYDGTTLDVENNMVALNNAYIYPCPATNYFMVNFPDPNEMKGLFKLTISDIAGRTVLKMNGAMESLLKVDCGFLKAGIYAVEINSIEKKTFHGKLLIN